MRYNKSISGLFRDNGNKVETTIVYWGYIGIMEKKVETAILYCGVGSKITARLC